MSSSDASSASPASVVLAEETSTGWLDPAFFRRENFGYTVPVIDPAAIVRPAAFDLSNEAVAGNLLWAILIALVMGVSGVILGRLMASNESLVKRILGRLPLQAVITVLLLWLIQTLVPDASAQGFDLSSVSLFQIPFYALAFFLVVGTSNYIFNNAINAEGDTFGQLVANRPFLSKFSNYAYLSAKKWFIVLLIIGYGILGAHINPEFSLLPGRQLGIILIVALSIVLSACLKDVMLYLMSRFWDMPGRFRANIAGFAIALVCIVLSRTLNLSPGYIYGVPVGLLILSTLYREREGYFEFLSIVWVLLLATIVWVAGSFVGPYEVLTDILNLFFVILVEDAFFEMLPLPYLAGGSIFRWRKVAWAVQFVTVVFFLFHTLFNPQGTIMNLAQEPPAAATLMLLFCYAAGVFLLWAYIVRKTKRAA